MLGTLTDSILSVVYPQGCRVCEREVEHSDDGRCCSDCWEATRIFTGNETLCDKCGAFLFGATSSSTFCRKCSDQFYDRAFSVGLYEKALSASVLDLKRTPQMPRRLMRLLTDALDRFPFDSSTVVIPIPLSSRRRLHERGFNQAAIIGMAVSKHLGLACDESTLVRKVHTPMHRVGMDNKARARTVRNAFEVVRPKLVADKNVLLVDDILTSGETASSCAKVLKKSGALIVNVMTIARAA